MHIWCMDETARLDLWLWAARYFRTRRLAVKAIEGGRIEVRGAKPKASKAVRVGDEIRIRHGPFEHVVTVRALSERRGPAAEAAKLYDEDPLAKQRRLRLAEQHRLAAQSFAFGEGKPSKKERRALQRLKGRQ